MRTGTSPTVSLVISAISTSEPRSKSPRASATISGSRSSSGVDRSGLAASQSATHGSSTPSSVTEDLIVVLTEAGDRADGPVVDVGEADRAPHRALGRAAGAGL